MTLLLFDIDGTLTATNRDDDRLYTEALEEVAGPLSGLGPWETFSEVTDAAIAREVITRRRGRPARDEDVWEVRQVFIAKWERAIASGEAIVQPVPGALELVLEARQRRGFAVALATGGWLPTAMMKLEQAGFPAKEVVVASADDAENRPAILRTAAVFAAAERGIPGFSSMIVVGDGVWDGRAATAVGAGFVGVSAEPAHTLRLRAAGAAAVVPDFADRETFWAAVEGAKLTKRSAASN